MKIEITVALWILKAREKFLSDEYVTSTAFPTPPPRKNGRKIFLFRNFNNFLARLSISRTLHILRNDKTPLSETDEIFLNDIQVNVWTMARLLRQLVALLFIEQC